MSPLMKRLRVLLTGGTGFIGSHLARRLEADGHDVHLLLRAESDTAVLGEAVHRIVLHRLAANGSGIGAAIRLVCPEIVVHLASLFLSDHRPEDVPPLVRSNVLFGAEVVEAATRAGVTRLVVAGTSWQHYQDAGYNPVNLYAATKQGFEDLLVFWSKTTPLRTIILKLFDTYGPGDTRRKLVPLLRRLASEGGDAPFSPGEQILDMVHVDDVVEAFIVAMNRTQELTSGACEVFAVSSGACVSLRQLVREFEEALGRPLPIAWGARSYRAREVMNPWSLGRALPGWRPTVSLAVGFRQLIASDV